MPINARSPRHRDGNDHHGEDGAQRDQRPGAFVVVEDVNGGAGLINLPSDPNVVACGKIGLPRTAAELQQRVRAGVRARVDGHQCLHTLPAAGRRRRGAAVSTAPTDGLPQSATELDRTCPASVVTAPPAAFWKGSGMSAFCWLGHNSAAPAMTAMPIATSSPRRLAPSGPNGAGPPRECECPCECEWVTPTDGSWPESCPAARWRWPGRATTAA